MNSYVMLLSLKTRLVKEKSLILKVWYNIFVT